MDDTEFEQALDDLLQALEEGVPQELDLEEVQGELACEELQSKLLAALDGPYRELRDDTHINPHTVLVYDEATDTVEAVDLCELPLKHPVAGAGARWSPSDLGELVASKALLYRQSKVATELHDKDPTSEAPCGTPVLAVPERPGPYYWFDVRARTLPGDND